MKDGPIGTTPVDGRRKYRIKDVLDASIPTLKHAIQATKKQITGIRRELKELLPSDKEAHTKKLQELEGLCAKAEAAVQGLRARQKHITDLGVDVGSTICATACIVPRHQEEDRRQDDSAHAAREDRHHARSLRQTDMDELIAAQEMILDAIFSHAEGPVN